MLLSYVDPNEADGVARQLLEVDAETYGRPSLFAPAIAHNPDELAARKRYVDELQAAGGLDARTAELAYVAVAAENDCPYCIASHSERLVEHVGLESSTVSALIEGDLGGFYDHTRTVVEIARTIADDPKRVGKDDLDRLRAAGFDEVAIVQLVAIVSAAVAATVIADTLNIDPTDQPGLDRYGRESTGGDTA